VVGLVAQPERFAHLSLVNIELLANFAQFIRSQSLCLIRNCGLNLSCGFQRENFLSTPVADIHFNIRNRELFAVPYRGVEVPFERVERAFATARADGGLGVVHKISVEAGEFRPRVRACCRLK